MCLFNIHLGEHARLVISEYKFVPIYETRCLADVFNSYIAFLFHNPFGYKIRGEINLDIVDISLIKARPKDFFGKGSSVFRMVPIHNLFNQAVFGIFFQGVSVLYVRVIRC